MPEQAQATAEVADPVELNGRYFDALALLVREQAHCLRAARVDPEDVCHELMIRIVPRDSCRAREHKNSRSL